MIGLLATFMVCVGCLQAGQPAAEPVRPSVEQIADTKAKLESRWQTANEAAKYDEAIESLKQLAVLTPGDTLVYFNLACVYCKQGDLAEGEKALRRCLELGFTDYARLLKEEDLRPLADSDVMRALGKGWRELQEARVDQKLAQFRRQLTVGKQSPEQRGYVFEKDEGLRLAYVSGFSRDGHAETKVELRRVASYWESFVLPAGPDGKPPPSTVVDGERPDGWVVVFLPNGPDFQSWARTTLGARADRVGGIYDHWKQQLVARDLGPTLRHEFCHALHWRSMSRLGQHHPIWLQEGLCALVEDIDLVRGGEGQTERLAPIPSWRTNTAKRMLRTNLLPTLSVLMTMDDKTFHGGRVLGHYAAGRAFFLWLSQQEGSGGPGTRLRDWYGEYTRGYEEDKRGIKATEKVMGMPIADADKAFRAWLGGLADVGEANQPGIPTLPADLQPVGGEGMVVMETGTRDLLKNPLIAGDVLVAVDGYPVRDQTELARLLGGWGGRTFKHGQVVKVKVRREGRTMEFKVRLND